MKKSTKKEAAPVVAPSPEIPPLFRDRLAYALEDGIETRARDKFSENSGKDFVYAFEWKMEEALKEAYRSGAFERLSRFVLTPRAAAEGVPEALPSDEKIVEVLRYMASEIERDLLGDTMFGSGDGPWASRSTSWATNVSKSVKASVDRGLRAVYLRLIEAYETRVRFEACFDVTKYSATGSALALTEAGFKNWTAVRVFEANEARKATAKVENACAEPMPERPENVCPACGAGPLCGEKGDLCPSSRCPRNALI